jgi:tetratricopeptide (TPR) repeat protein
VLLTASEEALVEHPEASELLEQIEAQVLVLGPLEPPEDELLIRALTGLEAALAARLAERSQGNPLLAIHIISDWIARGILLPSAEGFQLAPGVDGDRLPHGARLPDQMRELWRRRLWRLTDQIGGASVEALELAAVMGAEVNGTEWRALLGGWDPGPLTDALLRARLARPMPRGWAFIHGMLREVLIEQSRRAGRWARHHQDAAGLLASAESPELQERLGRHLLYAGQAREAFTHLMAAARTLDHRGISRAASRVVARAEEALDRQQTPPDDRRRCACRILMARIEIRRHHPRRWIADLEAQQALAHREGWGELEAEALWVLGEAYQKSDELALADSRLETGLALAGELGLPRLQQEIQVAIALLRLRRGDQPGAAPLLQAVLDMPSDPEAPTARLVAQLNLASIARIGGRLSEARSHAQKAIEHGVAEGCLDVVAHGQLILGAIAEREGDLTAAEAHLQESLRIVRRTSKFRAIALTHNSLGEIGRRQGRLDEAEAAYRSSLAWAAASGRPIEAPQINLALVLTRRERFAEARELLEQVLERVTRLGDRFISWHCRAFLLSSLAGMGDWAAFDAQLAAVLEDPMGHIRVNEDVAEEAELASRYALRAGHTPRALAVMRLARAHWLGLQRRHRIEAITRRIAELAG